MFVASAECLLKNLLSRICLLRFFKHNELKMSRTHFFQVAPQVFIIALGLYSRMLKSRVLS
jgi:hypothetical protein